MLLLSVVRALTRHIDGQCRVRQTVCRGGYKGPLQMTSDSAEVRRIKELSYASHVRAAFRNGDTKVHPTAKYLIKMYRNAAQDFYDLLDNFGPVGIHQAVNTADRADDPDRGRYWCERWQGWWGADSQEESIW